jgi:hypothetical protein
VAGLDSNGNYIGQRLVTVAYVVSSGVIDVGTMECNSWANKALVLYSENSGFLVGSFPFDVDELSYFRTGYRKYRLISKEKAYKDHSRYLALSTKKEVLDWLRDWEDEKTMCDGGYTRHYVDISTRRLLAIG